VVESQPSKLLVAGSIPVSRSSLRSTRRVELRLAGHDAQARSELRLASHDAQARSELRQADSSARFGATPTQLAEARSGGAVPRRRSWLRHAAVVQCHADPGRPKHTAK
jgi:hypothetical protein